MTAIGTRNVDEDEPERAAAATSSHFERDDEHVERRGDRLDDRVARGDLLAASAAAAAQDQPREDRDVVVGLELRARSPGTSSAA